MTIEYGTGWPWPKCTRKPGTVYRTYQDLLCDRIMVVAVDQDETMRAVEVEGKLWAMVTWPRRNDEDPGNRIVNEDDYETVLQAPEAWVGQRAAPLRSPEKP